MNATYCKKSSQNSRRIVWTTPYKEVTKYDVDASILEWR